MTGVRWDGFPCAETTIACSGEAHRLRWDAGELQLLDHADPEGERALAALGGERCTCVELLDSWARHAADLRVLVLGSRGTGDAVAGPDAGPRSRQGVLRNRSRGLTLVGGAGTPTAAEDPELTERQRLLALLSLRGGLDRRLIAEVAAHHRGESPPAPALDAALYGRVLAALTAWLGGPAQALELDLDLIADGETPSLGASGDPGRGSDPFGGAGIAARLPFGWLVDVWGRELEVVWGRFCLSATTTDGVNWELLTVGPDLGEPAVIRVALPR